MENAPRFVGELYQDRVPEPLGAWLAERLGDEPIWGAIETGTSRDEGDVWFIASAERNSLAAATSSGRWWRDLPATGTTNTDTKFAKRIFELDGDEIYTASRLGGGDLVRLFELAFVGRSEGLHNAALDHVGKKSWQAADDLFALAQTALTDEDAAPNVAYLNRAQKIAVRRAQCAMQLQREGDALGILAEVSAERGDDMIAATEPMHGIDGWLLTLALAHEEAGQPAAAAKVHAHLFELSPDQDLYLLSRARALRRADDLEESAKAYSEFVAGRAEDDFSLLREMRDDDERDDELVDADPDLVDACLESGELLEDLAREAEAAKRYLTLIRHAPFAREGYERLFRLRDALDVDTPAVTIAGEVLRLLQPDLASGMDGLPGRHEPVDLPHEYTPISEEAHDEKIVHAGERASGTVAQKWVGSLTSDARDTSDIERHARKVDGSKHPAVYELLPGIAAMLDIEVPRLFLSFGSSGVDVLGIDDPFVLLGSCHLDQEDERHLELRHLAFALGTQLEHIKAKHLILTSSEFWKTFGTKSATALLAFVPLGDLVGKLTDTRLLSWVGKLRGGTETKMIRSLLEIAESRVAEGATREGVQGAYTAALAKVRQVALDEEEPEDKPSMVKEQLTDFARSAQYTADRAGLLACDDLASAVEAMLLLSPTATQHAAELPTGGLQPLLSATDEEGNATYRELALRIGELVKFALSEDYQALRAVVTA